MRTKTGIDVMRYKPLKVETEQFGWVCGAYRVALLTLAGGMYIIDELGTGSHDLQSGGVYNYPVYPINPDAILFPGIQDVVCGTFPISVSTLQVLQMDRAVDLAQFIWHGTGGDERLERWVNFVGERRYVITT